MIVNLISGPRNISTALMYSFAQRMDTKVLDEPFYAHYLHQFPELDHPAREEILTSMPLDQTTILNQFQKLEGVHPLVFLKNMAHHHIGLNWDYLKPLRNIFLIRNPKQLIASFAQVIKQPTLQDIGLKISLDVYNHVLQHGDYEPIVLDSATILKNPEAGLISLCDHLEIPFTDLMLSWRQGPLDEDGAWAKYWYKNVHQSTGFVAQKTSSRDLPDHCRSLYQEAMPYYDQLQQHAITI